MVFACGMEGRVGVGEWFVELKIKNYRVALFLNNATRYAFYLFSREKAGEEQHE